MVVIEHLGINPVAFGDLWLVDFLLHLVEHLAFADKVDPVHAVALSEDNAVLDVLALVEQVE